jgi:hypothetical protein
MCCCWIAFSSIFCQLLIWIRLGAVLSFLSGLCAAIGVGLWPAMIGELMESGGDCNAVMHLGIFAALQGDPYYNGNNTLVDVWGLDTQRQGTEPSIDVYVRSEADPTGATSKARCGVRLCGVSFCAASFCAAIVFFRCSPTHA